MSNKTDSTLPVKPFSLKHAEAKRDLYNAVNNVNKVCGVPFYLIEDILTELLHQVKDNARIERENSLREYEKQLEEYKKQEAENEGVNEV